MPPASYEEILNKARLETIEYLVVDEKIKKDSPDFLDKIKEEDLVPIRELKGSGKMIVVFQVVY